MKTSPGAKALGYLADNLLYPATVPVNPKQGRWSSPKTKLAPLMVLGGMELTSFGKSDAPKAGSVIGMSDHATEDGCAEGDYRSNDRVGGGDLRHSIASTGV